MFLVRLFKLVANGCSGWRRAKANNCEASLAPLSTAEMALSMPFFAAVTLENFMDSISRLLLMTCRILLKSWATPPVNLPTASSF